MANKTIEDLKAQIEVNEQVEESAALLIKGIADRIKKAVDAAIVNGATAEELAPLTDEIAQLKASSDALSEAVAANTPAE